MENNVDEIMSHVKKLSDLSEESGIMQGKLHILEWLIKKGALRESMLRGMYVLYTEDGPVDVSLKEEGLV
jgi:hypothetical protein